MKIRRLTTAVLLLAGLQLSACSSDDDDNQQPAEDSAGVSDTADSDGNGDESGSASGTVVDVDTDRANDLRGLTFAADGKIYASGYAGTEDALKTTVLARFNADGTLDTTFGDAGIAEVDVAPGLEEA